MARTGLVVVVGALLLSLSGPTPAAPPAGAPDPARAAATRLPEDVPATCWAHDVVMALCRGGIMEPGADGRFRGNARLTRAELASAAVRYLRMVRPPDTEPPAPAPRPDDVPPDHPRVGEIREALALGAMQAFRGTFSPAARVTRHGLARVLHRLARIRAGEGSATDDPDAFPRARRFFARPASPAAIEEVTRLGILRPYYGGDFKGGNQVSRSGLAAALGARIEADEADEAR